MIKILVDEAYAFDFLAILYVKYEFSKNEKILSQIVDLEDLIENQIGKDKFNAIISSKEYMNVIKVNKETFEWVDKAKTDSCKASDVDHSNYKRCLARNALQEKFFPKKEISEIKFGYEKYHQ